MSLPEDVLRLAATYLRANGLSQGCAAGTAIDAEGCEIPLWATKAGETGRIRPNENAIKFTIYGAIVKALHASDRVSNQMVIFDVTNREALARLTVPLGGSNYVHALDQYNETPGLSAEDAALFLEECANQAAAIGVVLATLDWQQQLSEPTTARRATEGQSSGVFS